MKLVALTVLQILVTLTAVFSICYKSHVKHYIKQSYHWLTIANPFCVPWTTIVIGLFSKEKRHGGVYGGAEPLFLIFEDFVYFLRKWSNFGGSIQWIRLELFQGPQNYSFISVETMVWSYCKQCVKINIFHVLIHKSITTWVSEIPVQQLGSLECYL